MEGKIFGLLFLIAGVVALVLEIMKKKKYTAMVEGKVVDISRERKDSSDDTGMAKSGEILFYPVFEYNVDGNVYVKKSTSGSNNCPYFVGQSVQINYDPSNPNKYYIKSGSVIRMAISAVIAVVGIILIIVM